MPGRRPPVAVSGRFRRAADLHRVAHQRNPGSLTTTRLVRFTPDCLQRQLGMTLGINIWNQPYKWCWCRPPLAHGWRIDALDFFSFRHGRSGAHACSAAQRPTLSSQRTVARQAPLSMGFPRQEPGVGCRFLLQGIFPTQGPNPSLLWLLHCRQILYYWATGEGLDNLCQLHKMSDKGDGWTAIKLHFWKQAAGHLRPQAMLWQPSPWLLFSKAWCQDHQLHLEPC